MTAVNTMGGEKPRHENDAYYTPDALALAIARKVREAFGDFGLVVEPSAGQGAFVRAGVATWPGAPIVAVEPGSVEPGAFFGAGDAMRCRWEDAEIPTGVATKALIIGNPPFSLAESHIRIALDRMWGGDVLAFLLRGSFLAGSARVRGLWREFPPAHVWHIAPRPSFTGGGTDGAEYAVIAWVKGHTGPFAGGWLEWQR